MALSSRIAERRPRWNGAALSGEIESMTDYDVAVENRTGSEGIDDEHTKTETLYARRDGCMVPVGEWVVR